MAWHVAQALGGAGGGVVRQAPHERQAVRRDAAKADSPFQRGTGRRLRKFSPSIKLISFQPQGPFHGLEGLKHMDSAIVPGIYDPTLADEDLRIDTERAYRMVRRLAREEGLLAGISSGAAVAAVLDVAKRIERGVIVTIFPDGAEKYLNEKFWTLDE